MLNAGIYVSFVLFCNFGGNIWAWNDGRTVACVVVFAITQIYCVLTTHEDRLFPCEMVLDRTLVLLYVTMTCAGSSIFVTIYYVPLYFQFVNGDDGTKPAIRLLPFVCCFFATVYNCGRFMEKTGYFIYWYLASGLFLVVGGALMYTYTVHLGISVANICGYTILLAFGTTTSQAGYALAPMMVLPNRIHEAIQFMNIAQGQSLLLGLTIASAIFQNRTFDGLRPVFSPLGYSDAEIKAAVAGAKSTLLADASPEVRLQALKIIIKAIDDVYLMVTAAGVLYVICSCFLPRKR